LKIVLDMESLSERGVRIDDSDTFSFECHPEVSCFNKCCRNLNLFLYPHDIIMLKTKLSISSSEFIDRYTDSILREGCFFPQLLLKMSDNEECTCPFLTSEGCGVYGSRPDSCRNFPLEHGVYYDEDGNVNEKIHLFRPPEFCMGRLEKREHSLVSWAEDQNALFTNSMTEAWGDFLKYFYADPWAGEGSYCNRAKMAFMAIYNIDDFKKFVFDSSFLKRYKVKKSIQQQIRRDDVALLKFAYKWVLFSVVGVPTDLIKLKKK